MTDCLALMQLGLPAVSPVTVRIRAADWGAPDPQAARRRNRLHLPGQRTLPGRSQGALQTARTLAEPQDRHPPGDAALVGAQISARQELTERFGLTASVGPKELAKLLAGRPAEEIQAAEGRFSPPPRSTSTITLPPGIPRRISERLLAGPARPSSSACARCRGR